MSANRNQFDYINRTYGLSVKRGTRVEYTAGLADPQFGIVTGTRGPHVLILLNGKKNATPFHPTWGLRYFDIRGAA